MISWYNDSSCITPPSNTGPYRACSCLRQSIASTYAEEFLCRPDPVRQRVDLFWRVVQVEAGPSRRLHAECAVHRPSAMMPGPHRDAQLVKDLAHIVRMYLIDGELNRASPGLRSVHRVMRHRRGRVDHDDRAYRMRRRGDTRDRRHSTGDVRLVRHGNNLGSFVHGCVDVRQVDSTVLRHAEPGKGGPGALAQLLPWDQVGVVLELGDQHLVARPDR